MKRRFLTTPIRKWIPAFAGMTADTLDWEGNNSFQGLFQQSHAGVLNLSNTLPKRQA